MYLIPVNCLQFRNENDGEYAVNDINNGAIQSFNMFAEIKNHNDGKNVATPKQNTKLSNTLKLQKICDGKVESRPRLVVSPKLVKVADIKSGQSLFHPVIEKVKIPRKVGNITLVQSKVVSSGLPVRPSDPNAQFSVVRQVGVPTNPTMNLQCATSTNNFDTASTPVLPMNITRPHQYLVNSHSSLRSPNNSKDTSSDTVNTYEKMVTSDEDKHFLENALKNCFHGNGISDTDLKNYQITFELNLQVNHLKL
ncbi:hypothetical protein HHI36_004128 [Cryptolaemus montrouzieri]|uniref:Uncharacterized protein n=1 Tax=Cryptolaemus montrouzieri TaxID=559131 RepID=A0ABD2NR98_9CUCU